MVAPFTPSARDAQGHAGCSRRETKFKPTVSEEPEQGRPPAPQLCPSAGGSGPREASVREDSTTALELEKFGCTQVRAEAPERSRSFGDLSRGSQD